MNVNTFHITPYDLAFLGALFIGLTFTLQLWFIGRVHRSANRFLGLALLTIVLRMVWIVGIDIRLGNYFSRWSWLPLQFWLAPGPLIYFYVLKITRPEYKVRWKDLLHFSPLLLELGALVLEVKESINTGAATYDTPTFATLSPILQALAIISVTIYLRRCYKLIRDFHRRLKVNGADRPQYELRWLRRLLKRFGLFWLLWIPYAAAVYFFYQGQLRTYAYYPLYFVLAVMMIRIAATAFFKPDVAAPATAPPVLKPSPAEGLVQKGKWLRKTIEANLFYQDPDLSLRSLAETLDMQPNELSRIINMAFGKNFNDFVNEYRIREVTRKMLDPACDRITLLGIAMDSGFNSKSTFNRVFREMTGKSPVEYKARLKKDGPSYTLRPYSRSAAVVLRHETTPGWSSVKLKRNYMFKNYLKTAYRSLLKSKGFTFLNVLGLSLGLASCLLIIFYVADELSYDRYNTNASRIYRVNEDLKLGENNVLYAVAMPPLAKTLKSEFPYVEDAVRIKNAGSMHVKKETSTILENRIAFADPSLFNVFTLPMITGDPKSALAEPNSVVITESTALKYFNSTNVVGRSLTFDDKGFFKITGVIKDIPTQSHFNFDFFISMETYPDSRSNEWLRSDYNTYVLLKDASDGKKLEAALPAFLNKFSGDQMRSQLKMDMAAFEKSGSYFRLNLTPLTDIHLKSNRTGELGPNGTVQYVYIFSAIALFILLIACVNFMNLSTARSANRAREVGVRKVLGSAKKQLIAQFLTESVLLTFVATVIAFTAAVLLLPAFNQLSGKEISLNGHSLAWLIPALLFIVVFVGALAGSYPAFYLSAFRPADVLKGKIAAGFKSSRLRSFLVVFQFAISIFLIIGTLVIYNQLHFIQTKDLGYNRNQVLIIQNAFELKNQAQAFKQEVKQLPGVADATLTGFLPTAGQKNTAIFYKDATFDQKKALFPQIWQVDEDYIKTLDMKMAAGRNFSREMLTDSSGIIINQAAAKFLALNEPLNKPLYKSNGGDQNAANSKQYHVIGVVKDFNFSSLRDVISPLVLVMGQNNGALSVRVQTKNIPGLLAQIQEKWKAFSPGVQLNFSFMDQDFDATYRTEQRVGTIFIVFTTMAIIIACLGLFGLAAYAAEQRTKEIGVRKILGASIATIAGMLSVDFIKLVFIAILVATPVAWYAMNHWLQDFAYRVGVQWWVLAIAGIAALLIAFITISFQSIKAALANPVNSLRSE